MATHTNDTLLGGAGGTALLPRSISDDIWNMTKRPAASIVGELENKPDSQFEVGAKSIKPIKAVVGLEFSMETVETNPSNVLEMIGSEMSGALARQIDLAVLHGRQASDGRPLSGNPEHINQTSQRVALSIKAPEKADAELWDGYNQVIGGDVPQNTDATACRVPVAAPGAPGRRRSLRQ